MPRGLRLITPVLAGISMDLVSIVVLFSGTGIRLDPTQGQVFASSIAPDFGVINPGLEVVEVEPGGLQPGDKLKKDDLISIIYKSD